MTHSAPRSNTPVALAPKPMHRVAASCFLGLSSIVAAGWCGALASGIAAGDAAFAVAVTPLCLGLVASLTFAGAVIQLLIEIAQRLQQISQA